MIVFWIYMMIIDLLIPFTMIGFGKAFLNKAPKNISYSFGYRSTMSMKSRDTWEFAHKHCGKLWLKLGIVLLPISILPLLFTFGKNIASIGTVGAIVCCAQIIILVVSLISTEFALKRVFDQNGIRKNKNSV